MVSTVATAVAESNVKKKIRIKVTVKKPDNEGFKSSQLPKLNSLEDLPIVDGRIGKKVLGGNNRVIGFSKQVSDKNSSVTMNRVTTVVVGKKLDSIAGTKRKSEEVLERHEPKRLKMDRPAISMCYSVLTKLMVYDQKRTFSAPVRPEAWGINDYFDIIKKPMDLGTIKQKLQQHKYVGIEEFEADVRLTFDNAMLYNPPSHWVHQDANCLVKVFDDLWKPLKMKLYRQLKDTKQGGSDSSHGKSTYDVKGQCQESKTQSHLDQFSGKAMPRTKRGPGDFKNLSVEGQCRDLKAVKDSNPKDSLPSKAHPDCKPKESLPTKTHSGYKPKDSLPSKTHSGYKPKDSLPSKTHSGYKPKDSLLSETHLGYKPKDSLPSKTHSDCKLRNSLPSTTHFDCKHKEPLSSKTHSDISVLEPVSHPHERACPMYAKMKCDSASGKKTAHGALNAVKVKHTATSSTLRTGSDSYGQDSDGISSFINIEHSYDSLPSTTTGSFDATAKGLETVSDQSDVELSPSTKPRATELKIRRFEELILKAQQNILFDPYSEAGKKIRQQDKEMLQRQQEKSKLVEKIRAAKSAARLKAETEHKKQIQEAREANRMAIKKMEQSVRIDDNIQVLKDLEALIGSSLVVMCHDHRSRATEWSRQVNSDKLKSPLERLGLYIKEEYSVGYDDDDYNFLEEGDLEEGELIG